MSAACPLCRGTDTVRWRAVPDHVSEERFELRRCPACDFAFTWPPPADLQRYYPAFYRRYGRGSAGLLQRVQQGRARRWARAFDRPGRCLEIGSGEGWMLAAIRDLGWRVVGLERTATSAAFARHVQGLSMLVGSLEAIRPDARFELIVLHHVLEHLPDPAGTLLACRRLLAPGGRIVVAVPNFASWQRAFAGPYWLHLDVPRHLGHFTPRSLRYAFSLAGLHLERLSFVSWEYDAFGWIESVLNRLGFPLNTLLRVLQHDPRLPATSATSISALALAMLLLLPALALALASWVARRGAAMEAWATAGG